MTEADFGFSLADNVYRRFVSKSGTGFGGLPDHGIRNTEQLEHIGKHSHIYFSTCLL